MKQFIPISSKENAVFKLTSMLLSSSKRRKKEGLFVIEGLRICRDAYENGVDIRYLLVSNEAFLRHKNELSEFSEKAEKCFVLSDELISKLSDTVSPQGVIMVAEIPEKQRFNDKNGRYIALENLQDPSNLGAVSRTAEALGISGIVITDNGCDPYSPKVLRASMGTLIRMPLFITDNIIDFAKENGLRTVSCVVDADANDIKTFDFRDGDILLIGNEGNGLTNDTKRNSDCLVTIRMSGKAESLNAASAAAIAVWEMCK